MSEPRHRGRIRPGQINVNGKSYDFDVSELELDEVADVEEAIGVPMGDWAARSMRATIGFIWAIVRRTDPDFTLEDARKLKFGSTLASDDDDGEGESEGGGLGESPAPASGAGDIGSAEPASSGIPPTPASTGSAPGRSGGSPRTS